MKKAILFAVCGILIFGFFSNKSQAQLVLPTKEQVKWSEAEIGVIIHYDINIFAPETFKYKDKNTLPPLNIFNPTLLNTDQWLESAAKIGAKYAVLVAKHGTGFCLWPTKAHDYHVGNTPLRGGKADIVAEFIASCKKFNIKPGIYYNTNVNTLFGSSFKKFNNEEQLAYNKIVIQQLTELWTQYGKLFEIWFDGGVMTDEKMGIASTVTDLIKQHQPQAILFQGPSSCNNLIRWIGNEDGRAPYPHWSTSDFTTSSSGVEEIVRLNGKPDGKIWCPGEADFPNRKKSAWNGGWLWHEGQEKFIFSSDELVDRYYTSVGNNANMLVGMVIDTDGLFPSPDAQAFKEFGEKIQLIFKNRVASTKGKGNIVELKISRLPALIDHVVIQEDISTGERIREYNIEAWMNGSWKTICEGTSVGHKRIHKIPEIETTKIRLNIKKYLATPQIKELSVFGKSQ